jgi:hypothetical protein
VDAGSELLTDFSRAPGWSLPGFGVRIFPSFLTEAEHDALAAESERSLAAQRRGKGPEDGHWDGVIVGYRETPVLLGRLSPLFRAVAARVYALYPPEAGPPMPTLHILELQPEPMGRIDSHVDSVKFSGGVVAGLCLLSDAVMVLRHETSAAEVSLLLPSRCLYLLTGEARYAWGHAIPAAPDASSPVRFRGAPVVRGRRISVMFRDELVEDEAAKKREVVWTPIRLEEEEGEGEQGKESAPRKTTT